MARKTIEQRLQEQEDIQAIMRLKAAYVDAADGGWTKQSHNGPACAKLFVKDCSWGSANFPEAVGHKGILRQFAEFRRNVPIAVHLCCNPNITVKGDTAVGEWHFICLHSSAEGRDSFTLGKYTDHFVRTPKGWRFKILSAELFMHGPYADGWTRLVGYVKAFNAKQTKRLPAKRKGARKKK
jgi:hypothetical protein